jgi:hypothetical protein
MPACDLRDCSRQWLEAAADMLETAVRRGEPLQARLDEVLAALANDPPEYDITYGEYRR